MKHLLIILLILPNLIFGQDAQNSNYPDTGLEDIIKYSLETNSGLTPIEFENKIMSARIDKTNFQPSPSFQFMLDFLPVDLSNAGEYIGIYSQPLRLFGKLDAEENLAKVNSQRPGIEKNALENELIRSVKENYFMLSVNERLLSFNKEFKEIIEAVTSALEIKYSSGKGSQYDILKSNNEIQKLLLEEIELKGNKKIFINNLKTLSNLDLPDNFTTKNIEILLNIPVPDMDTSKLISEMKLNNTDFKFIEQMLQENQAEQNIISLERKPDLNLMSGYKYKSEKKSSFLMFSVMVELPFMPWNEKRIEAEIKEKLYREKKINSESKSIELNLKNDLKNIIVKINSSLEKINYLNEVLIPQTEQTFRSSLISYETDSNQFLDLLDTYRSLRENSRMLAEEETNYLIMISSLEKLIGKQILTIN